MSTKKTKLHLIDQPKLALKNRAKCGLQSDSKITDFLRLDQTSSIKQQSSKEPLIKRFHRQNDQKSKVLSILQSQVRGRFPSTWSWQHYLASFQVIGYIKALEETNTSYLSEQSFITDVKFDPIGELFATTCSNGTIEVFNFDSFLIKLMQHKNQSYSTLLNQLETIQEQRKELQRKSLDILKNSNKSRTDTNAVYVDDHSSLTSIHQRNHNLTSQSDNILSLKKSILPLTREYPITKQTNIETYLSTHFDCSESKKRKIDTIDLCEETISENKEDIKFFSFSEKEQIERKNFKVVSSIMQPPQKKQKSDNPNEMNSTNFNEKSDRFVHHQTFTPTSTLQTNQSVKITPTSLSYPSHSIQNTEQLREYEMKQRLLERQENEIKEKLLVEGPNCSVLYETSYKPSALCWNVCNTQQFLVAFSNFGQIFVYDVDYDEPRKQKFETVSGGWGGNVNDIAFLKDSKSFVGGGRDGVLRVWDVTLPRKAQLILSGNKSINSIEVSLTQNSQVYAATVASQILCWDIRKSNCLQRTIDLSPYVSNISTEVPSLCSFKVHPFSEEIIYLDFFFECVVVNTRTSTVLFRKMCPMESGIIWPIMSMKKTRSILLPTSQFCMGTPRGLCLFDLPPFGRYWSNQKIVVTEAPLSALAWHPKCDFIVAANLKRSLELIGPQTLCCNQSIKEEEKD